MKVAVTGVGGGVGQSIMKALTISSLDVDIFAIDVQPFSAGLFRAVEGLVLPKPETPGGLETWRHSLNERGIDAVIPGSDHDLLPLASVRESWATKGECHILVSDPDLVETCRDKAATVQALDRAGVPVPRSAWDLSADEAVDWAKSTGFPVVIKARGGSGSSEVHVVQDEEEASFFFRRTPSPILQEHLSPSGEEEEFTCAVFVDREGSPQGTFMARRELSNGATYRAEINFWPEIHELLLAIGSALHPRGVLNVQLMLTKRGPVPFELNIRCSGTSAIRAYFGFNEPEMFLRHYILGEPLNPTVCRTGYVLRYWNEVFLDGVEAQDLRNGPKGLKGMILAWP